MLFKLSAGIHRILSVGVMSIAAGLTGSPSREMLDHRIDTLVSPAIRAVLRGLEALTVSPRHFHGQLRMFPEGVRKPHPSRLRGQINLRR